MRQYALSKNMSGCGLIKKKQNNVRDQAVWLFSQKEIMHPLFRGKDKFFVFLKYKQVIYDFIS